MAAWLPTLCLCLAAAPNPERPNIVLAMADDQGRGDVGDNGAPRVRRRPDARCVWPRSALAVRPFRRGGRRSARPPAGSVMTRPPPNRFGCFLG